MKRRRTRVDEGHGTSFERRVESRIVEGEDGQFYETRLHLTTARTPRGVSGLVLRLHPIGERGRTCR